MKTRRLTALAMLAGLAATACDRDIGGTGPGTPLPPSQADVWVGLYVGTANAEMLEEGESYRDVPVCLEMWVNDRVLHARLNVQTPALEDLADDPGETFPQERASRCGGEGLIMRAQLPVDAVTSMDALRLKRSVGDHVRTEHLWFEIDRLGDEFVGSVSEPNFRLALTVTKID